MLGLRLRSLFFNVGWYVGSTIIAVVGMPILLLSRAANIAWANVWIDFCLRTGRLGRSSSPASISRRGRRSPSIACSPTPRRC
jgi:hypothetical protein